MDYVEGYAPVYGGTIPAGIWHTFMSGALTNMPVENFATPSIAPPSYTTTQTYTERQFGYTTPSPQAYTTATRCDSVRRATAPPPPRGVRRTPREHPLRDEVADTQARRRPPEIRMQEEPELGEREREAGQITRCSCEWIQDPTDTSTGAAGSRRRSRSKSAPDCAGAWSGTRGR